MSRAGQLLGTILFTLNLPIANAFAADAIEFIVLGDMPYSSDQFESLKYIGYEIQAGGYPFVVHYGDVKSGREKCSDAVLMKSKKAIYGLLEGRVFYTPGDNDWTDCDRERAGGFDEMERLARLREIFYADRDLPSVPEWRIVRQEPDYRENAQWRYGGVEFVTLHIVGTDNGRRRIMRSDEQAALEAVDARDRANLAWLDEAFDKARRDGAEALVAFIHGDPNDIEHRDRRSRPCTVQEPVLCNPYLTFLERLTRLADAFDKPVLLVHGSTNRFCLDTGFGGWRANRLWRLNGPGDFVDIDAAVVRFDPHSRTPFQVHGLLSRNALPACDPG